MSRMREDKFLKPLTGPVKRKRFVVYDIESKADNTDRAGFTRPFLTGFYDGAEYVSFRDVNTNAPWQKRHFLLGGTIDRFMRHVLTPEYEGATIYAHNGGNFDHLFILAWLKQHQDEFEFTITPVQSTIQQLEVRRRRAPYKTGGKSKKKIIKWTFLDSLKLLPMGLDKAAKTFGLAGKVEMDLHLPENDPRWEEYLRQDCLQLYEVLVRAFDMIENRLGGEVGMTAPSTSMKLFRRKYLGRNGAPRRLPRHAHFPGCTGFTSNASGQEVECLGCAHDWIRRSYYGGRTEIFEHYGENLHYYDINSSYVAAMAEGMPVGDRMISDTLDWRMMETCVGFCECEVWIPTDCVLPPLPHRAENGKLVFPTGYFSGVWNTEELALLFDPQVKGQIISVKQTIWFGRKKVFDTMVQELWGLRDKSRPDFDEGLSALAKLLGNSLYGKFAMKEERQQIVMACHQGPGVCFLCSAIVEDDKEVCSECAGAKPANPRMESEVWYQTKHVSAPYIIPQISAHITTLARIRIWKFMQQALALGGKLYYSDTDSIITDVVLPSSGALGALKDEYPGELLRGAYIQPKVYMIEKMAPVTGHPAEAGQVAALEPVAVSKVFEGEHLPACEDRKKCKGCSPYKIAMKGFPKKCAETNVDVRTKENLELLQAGGKVRFKRLCKVRSLAREGFREGPVLHQVEKSFQSTYDKRIVLSDGSTRPLVLGMDEGRPPPLEPEPVPEELAYAAEE